MGLIALRSGTPGGRLGPALAGSLVLHLMLLFPPGWRLPVAKPDPLPPLMATLVQPEPPTELASELATRPEPEPPPAPLAKPNPPAAASPVPALRQPPPRELKGKALNSALAALAREDFYPREAIERGLEGRVVLLLTLADSGAVAAVEVAGTSGHAILDAAAVKAAGRIGRLAGGGRQVLLPVEFRLE